MTDSQKQTLGFEAEVDQLLHLMTHSLYSNKEIFLRELISNASDAADKLQFEALSDSALFEKDSDLKIHVDFDKEKRTITISDNGYGMSRDDIIENLGTIAKSGTNEFKKALEEKNKDKGFTDKLIGQFGVGFYSAFIVSDKVVVTSRKAGLTKEHGVHWESTGSGKYTVENVDKETRGTEIVLHLKKAEDELLDSWRLRNIITKYSDHIALPIFMKKIDTTADKDKKDDKKDDKKEEKKVEWETVNRAQAMWARPKCDIKDEDYKELYKHISHDFEDPLLWSHNKVEGKVDYISLLYLPARAPFDLWMREHQRGLKLYQNRVFIMDEAEQFLPVYLRFVKGVVDCADLPLNISREILQSNKTVTTIKSALSKRILKMLSDLAKSDKEKYAKFWKEFGKVLKEGPGEDFENREAIANLLRFSSTHTDNETQDVSLVDYVSRMNDKQDKIYYVTADTFSAAKNSPHLEIFRKKGIEVLLLTDKVDEWLVSHLTEFDKKQIQSVAKGDLDIDKFETEEEKKEQKDAEKDFQSILDHAKKILGEKIKDIRLTHRLTASPACIVADATDMNINLQRMLKSAGQDVPDGKPIFEINPEHAIIKNLKKETDDDRFAEWVNILFDQAVLAEGGQLDDPASFVTRLNKLLMAQIG